MKAYRILGTGTLVAAVALVVPSVCSGSEVRAAALTNQQAMPIVTAEYRPTSASLSVVPVRRGYGGRRPYYGRSYRAYRPYYGGRGAYYRPYVYRPYVYRPYGARRNFYGYRPYGYGYYNPRYFGFGPRYY